MNNIHHIFISNSQGSSAYQWDDKPLSKQFSKRMQFSQHSTALQTAPCSVVSFSILLSPSSGKFTWSVFLPCLGLGQRKCHPGAERPLSQCPDDSIQGEARAGAGGGGGRGPRAGKSELDGGSNKPL